MNLDLDLQRVYRILEGGPVRRKFWRLVHKMPCAVVHRICPLCHDEGMCDRCCRDVFANAWMTMPSTTEIPAKWITPSVSSTFTGGTTVAITNPWGMP